MSLHRPALLVGLALAMAVAGCSIKNPDFCCSSPDSCAQAGVGQVTTCADPAQPICDDDGLFGPARACVPDPGITACTGPDDCATLERPVCDADDSGTCIGCRTGDDCVRFATTPLCDEGSGECVACRTSADCSGANPVCGTDHSCQPCAADGECAAGLCTTAGSCPAADAIIHVDRAAAAGNAMCSAAAPCRTIAGGLAVLSATRRYLKMAPGTYAEQVILDGRTVEVYAAGVELASSLNPVVELRNNASLTVAGLRIRGGMGRGLRCNDSVATLRDGGLEDNIGVAVEGSDCDLTLERMRVMRNVGGGLFLFGGGRITIRNSFIGKNGAINSSVGGASIQQPFDLTLEFTTFAENTAPAGVAAGLICQASSSVTVASNIIVGPGATQVAADSCAPRYTLSNQMIAGATNLRGMPTFVNQAGGDYHLAPGSMGIDQADPAATLATDFDRESRPNGARADIGADEVH